MTQHSCHCGAVEYGFEGLPESATACNCTVCRRYRVLWGAYGFEGEGIHVSGPTQLTGKKLSGLSCKNLASVFLPVDSHLIQPASEWKFI